MVALVHYDRAVPSQPLLGHLLHHLVLRGQEGGWAAGRMWESAGESTAGMGGGWLVTHVPEPMACDTCSRAGGGAVRHPRCSAGVGDGGQPAGPALVPTPPYRLICTHPASYLPMQTGVVICPAGQPGARQEQRERIRGRRRARWRLCPPALTLPPPPPARERERARWRLRPPAAALTLTTTTRTLVSSLMASIAFLMPCGAQPLLSGLIFPPSMCSLGT